MGKKKRYYKTLTAFPPQKCCCICLKDSVEEDIYGEIHQIYDIVLHYFCLLSASSVEQNGEDEDGILGFLVKDIKAELARAERRKCHYCKKNGATVVCSGPNCGLIFHLPCGLKNGSLHQYFKDFRSFCKKHKPRQEIPSELRKLKELECILCSSDLKISTEPYIWPACCKPSSVLLHKHCTQRMASNSGYVLKCPLCNNVDTFGACVREFGIFVPDKEASWEDRRRGNEVATCIASLTNECKCPKGPKYSLKANKRWYIEICQYCGSGMHLGCMATELGRDEKFVCETCKPVDKAATAEEPSMEVEIAEEVEEVEIVEEVEEVEIVEEVEEVCEVTRLRRAVGLDWPGRGAGRNRVRGGETARSDSVKTPEESRSNSSPPTENIVETIVISDASDDEAPTPDFSRLSASPPVRSELSCAHKTKDDHPPTIDLVHKDNFIETRPPPAHMTAQASYSKAPPSKDLHLESSASRKDPRVQDRKKNCSSVIIISDSDDESPVSLPSRKSCKTKNTTKNRSRKHRKSGHHSRVSKKCKSSRLVDNSLILYNLIFKQSLDDEKKRSFKKDSCSKCKMKNYRTPKGKGQSTSRLKVGSILNYFKPLAKKENKESWLQNPEELRKPGASRLL